MHHIKKWFLVLAAFLGGNALLNAGDLGQKLRQEGKINTVIVVAGILFAGIIIWLVALDRRISRMEKEANNTNKRP